MQNSIINKSIVTTTNISDKDYEAYNLLGIAHGGIQEYAAAILVWEKSLSINPDQSDIIEMIKEYKKLSQDKSN